MAKKIEDGSYRRAVLGADVSKSAIPVLSAQLNKGLQTFKKGDLANLPVLKVSSDFVHKLHEYAGLPAYMASINPDQSHAGLIDPFEKFLSIGQLNRSKREYKCLGGAWESFEASELMLAVPRVDRSIHARSMIEATPLQLVCMAMAYKAQSF